MALTCPTTIGLNQDKQFNELKNRYRDMKLSDDVLLSILQAYREQNDLDIDWYPVTNDDYRSFSDFLKGVFGTELQSNVTKESLAEMYKTMNTLYTPQRLNNRLDRIASLFSDYVTNLVKKSSFGVTRQQVIERQATGEHNGFDVILRKVFDYINALGTIEGEVAWFKKNNPGATDEFVNANKEFLSYRAGEFKKMYDNRESLGMLAALRIGSKEGFAVNIDGLQYDFSDIEQMEDIDYSDEEDGVDSEEARKGDRYEDYRTLKLSSTISAEAKRLLDSLWQMDKNGNVLRDDLKYPVRINMRQAIVSLHKALQYSTPETFMDDLLKSVQSYPWMRGLYDRLMGNPDEQALVYATFKKSRSEYYYSAKNKNGRLIPRSINNVADGRGLSREAGMNVGSGFTSAEKYSVVDSSGDLKNADTLNNIRKAIDAVKKFSKDQLPVKPVSKSDNGSRWTIKDAESYWKEIINSRPVSDFDELTFILRGVGFNINADDLKYALSESTPISSVLGTVKRGNDEITYQVSSLDRVLDSLSEIIERADYLLKDGNDVTGSHLFSYAQDEYRNIADILSAIQSDELEERSLSGNKSLAAATTPSALHEMVDKLSNAQGLTDEEYRQMVINDYGQYEGMSLVDENGNTRLVGWLSDLVNDGREGADQSYKTMRKSFKVIDFTDVNINKRNEFANMTTAEHMVNSYVMFAKGAEGRTSGLSGRMYEIPIQADYETAYNFIVAPDYAFDELVERLAQEIECEAQRIVAIRERQSNDPTSGDPIRGKADVYEKRGVSFQIFPSMNDNGFRERYAGATSNEAHNIARQEAEQQLKDLLVSERTKLEELGFFTSDNMKLMGIRDKNDKSVNNWILNGFYAREQFTKIMFGGLEQFKSTSDFEKRNMYSHAQRLPMYTKATYRGENIGKESQNVIYISDEESISAVYDHIVNVADRLFAEHKVSAEQRDAIKAAYMNITTTDGQGFRTLDSMRDVKIMSGIWEDSDEVAYQHIKSKNYTPEDVQHFIVGIKSVYTGYEILPAQPGKFQKPVRVPVLHKYSETVLLPEMFEGIDPQTSSAPLQAFNALNDSLGKNKIDLFLFGSGVKIGAGSVIDIFAKDSEGNRILRSADAMSGFLESKVKKADFWIHKLPYKYYGITSPMHADIVDTNIAWATQAEKEAWGNIRTVDENGSPVEEYITVAGKPMKAIDARNLFYRIKAARSVDTFKRLVDKLSDKTRVAKILKEELASKPYQSRELLYALQMRDNGKFAYPLYSPNIQHDVTALLASIVKKAFTKVPTKGANMTQTTSLGLDAELENTAFDDNVANSGFTPLEVKFDDNGNFQYVEAYLPIYDSRLVRFADKNGNITPERLDKLVDDKIIPESILNFIAYRTPSDAEHSVIPCRVKGFISNIAGPSIRLPREIMKMTGHDYDGDKMRCHFKEFYEGWDNAKIKRDFEKFSNTEAVLAILDANSDPTLTPYEVFRNNATSELNPESERYRVIKEVQYDFSKEPLDNITNGNYDKLNNAMIDLMFAQLTSENGSLKMFIPGGAAETLHYADTIGTRKSETAPVSPFAVTHATESHDYMMNGAGMIGVYAVYNSSASMFQRLNLSYVPEKDNSGDNLPVSMFGKTIGKLFPVISDNNFATLGQARQLNAAVDNGKEPLLGYLNQTAGLAHLNNFLQAAGISEEEVCYLFNQPVMRKLADMLKDGSKSFKDASKDLILTLQNALKERGERSKIYKKDILAAMSLMTKEQLSRHLGKTFNNILSGSTSEIKDQLTVLQTMRHLNSAARDLDEFTKLCRPEASSGGVDASLGGTISRIVRLDAFRSRLDPLSPDPIRISGISDVLDVKQIYPNTMSEDMIAEEVDTRLPEVTALNSLMKDYFPNIMREYFPQARESWLRVQQRISSQYKYTSAPANVMDRIGTDMILWKLLSDRNFITGNPQEEQERIIIDVPNKLRALKERIEKAKQNPGKDKIADSLVDNIFIGNLELGATIGVDNKSISRIRFKIDSATLEDTADTVRADWGAMLYSEDEDVKNLAQDLFKYNLYTNGFGFGRYEFAHYAPASVIFSTHGYINALNNVLESDWAVDEEDLFYHQYLLNHWGDAGLMNRYTPDKLPVQLRNMLGFTAAVRRPVDIKQFTEELGNSEYFVLRTTNNKKTTDNVYRIVRDSFVNIVDLELAPKLGIRNRNGQVIVQYNPRVRDISEVKPVFSGNDVAWEGKNAVINESDAEQEDEETDRTTAAMNADDDYDFGIAIPTSAETVKKLQEETGKASALNSGKLSAEQAAAFGFEDEEPDARVVGENISSNGSDFAKKLTNPGNNLTVEYKGTKFRNAEHAYQTWKSGTFDEVAYRSDSFKPRGSKPADRNTNYQTMVEILTAKLNQHPELISGIKERGGVQYLSASIHNVVGDKYWESAGQNKFIEALTDAYRNVTSNSNKMFYVVSRDESGNIVTGYEKATPSVVEQARMQQAFHELNKKLREILAAHGISVGVLDDAEARLMAAGVTDFSAAKVLGEGMKELIRIANGIEGEYALPEEFAHVAIEMLGHDHPLVSRLLNVLRNDNAALEEAYGGQLEQYRELYGNNMEKLVTEAAGKLVAKQLFQQEYIKTNSVRGLIKRICDAIKSFFRRFNTKQIDDAIMDADNISSQLARDLLSGRLADEMKLEKITESDKFFSIEKDVSDKKDILSKMKQYTSKRRDVLERRMKHTLGKGASSRSLDVTKAQLEKLEKAEQNQKLEITVIDYLKDTMDFMREMEKSVDNTINTKSANVVCRKLGIIKDTLYSFSSVVEDVRKAIADGELEDDVNLKSTLKDVSDKVADFWTKYNNISMMYFEQFLSGVYGKDGVTVTVGRDKGKHISIEEMARYAERDISTASRLLSAISDCNDYVLLAIDDVTRNAKYAARERLREVRPKFEAAFAELVKDQGNRDQSWMYERELVNGKMVRTGRYISPATVEAMSEARQNYYRVFMELKELGDLCVPDAMRPSPRKMIMFRKQHYEKMREAEGVNGKVHEEWENAKRSLLEMEDIDYENVVAVEDFGGNIVDQLPLKFLNKGKNESYDDMTEDAGTSLMAYLGMAFEYQEMNNVIGILENARYASSMREVKQKRGFRNLIEKIGKENEVHYTKPITVKQAKTNIQKAMNDFFTMHVYGHLEKDEGTIGKTRISKRKATNALVGYTSLTQMALNIHQRIANVNTGLTQIVVETAGGKIKAKDVAKAAAIWVKESADRLAETGKTDYSNKLSLWMDYFDIHQDNGRDAKTTKYGKGDASRAFNSHLLYATLSIGEDYLSGTTALAFAMNFKMKGPNNEDSNLWDAYRVDFVNPTKFNDKGEAIDGTGAYLRLKDGYTKADGTALTREDERLFMKEVVGTNFELQGIYNVDDRSAIQQHSLGALAIMYRKWIAPAVKRRYAGVQYNKLKGEFTEGYYTTAVRLATDTVKDWFSPVSEEESDQTIWRMLTDLKAMKDALALNWDKMNDYEKGNIKKAGREMMVVFGLIAVSALMSKLPSDDDDDNKFLSWSEDILYTQILRLRAEIGSQAPTPNMLNEALRIMSSPFAALKPLTSSINILKLLWPPYYFEEVESGKYRGRTKAHKYFMQSPLVALFRKFDNFVDPSDMLNYYKNQNY